MASDDEELVRNWNVKDFRSVKTIIPITIQLLFVTGLEIASLILAFQQPQTGEKCRSYFILLYLHGAHWFIAVIVDQIVKYEHNTLRMNGYLEFHRNTLNHHRLPFYIVSLWTSSLFMVQTLVQHFYLDHLEENCLRKDYLTPLSYYTAIISLEFLLLLFTIGTYIRKVCRFNKLKPLPDVQREEWACTMTQSSFIASEIGHGIQQTKFEDFLEKQADLIQYLRDHNQKMSEKIMILNAQLRVQDT